MKVEKLIRVDLDVQGITLLSIEEYKKHKRHITPIDCVWWLRSPGCRSWLAAYVGSSGIVNSNGDDVDRDLIAVRPALQVANPKSASLKIGDKFCLFGYEWTVISKELALCDEVVGKHAFREDWQAEDANDYEQSDVKRFLEEWLDRKRAGRTDLEVQGITLLSAEE